ncbi:MAG: GTP-binding protein [Rhodobacterales bacterium]|nr:GTP-binding protein [Rhodobacterales bacterium]
MVKEIPIILISGYLGAGKTTLINNLLRHSNGKRLAVLVNEFGELAIDEDLIEAENDKLISISGGCICCSFGDDLTGALSDLANFVPKPDYILIESSGVALPNQIVANVGLLNNFFITCVVCIVDCSTILQKLRDGYVSDLISNQIESSNLVILNKTDNCTKPKVELIKDKVSDDLNANVIASTTFSNISFEILEELQQTSAVNTNAKHSNDIFDSMVIHPVNIQDPKELGKLLLNIAGIERAKGYFEDISGKKWLIQISSSEMQLSEVQDHRPEGLVIIGLRGHFDTNAILDLVS